MQPLNGYARTMTVFPDLHTLPRQLRHPEVRENRRRGWRIYWERPANFRELERTMADTVPEPPYHYD